MAILIDRNSQVVVQGITGREARAMLKLMVGYGTKIIAGVTPGKGGQEIDGIKVYNTVKETREYHPGLNTAVLFVPARLAKEAVFEAIDAGLPLVVLIPERVPQQDMLEIIEYSQLHQAHVVGPNTVGICSPGEALVGMISGRLDAAKKLFRKGPCGVISRSGSGAQAVPYLLTQAGVGQSTVLSTGGDPFVGATWPQILELFEKDEQTEVVVGFGEIGTTMEEDAAQFIKAGMFTKPFVAYVAGRYALPNVRFGHAGAIISATQGDAQTKMRLLSEAGATVVEHMPDLGQIVKGLLKTGKMGR